jgi:transcriptional regulator with XRE-family HTH domain
MEMKLSGTRIKELRLKLSWSQEKLAEQAGLNPRTVQRAESEGSASLRTRLQLAQALCVLPGELDAEPAAVDAAAASPALAHSGVSIYYLTVLLLVSIVYLAAQPAYFSVSVTHFSWAAWAGWTETGVWLVVSVLVWAMAALPILHWLMRKHRVLFARYLAAFSVALGLTVLRIWVPAPAWLADGLTALLSLSGLALLLSLYVPRLDTTLLRHVACMQLAVYLFLWFFNKVIGFIVGTYMFVEAGRQLTEVSPAWYVAGSLVSAAGDLVQLIPFGLVLILSFARRPDWTQRAERPAPAQLPPLSST